MHAPLLHVKTPTAPPLDLAALQHVWRASELACGRVQTCSTGNGALDAELPGGGWPRSSLTELLPAHPGVGEMQLLRPALTSLASHDSIAFIQPPFSPQVAEIQRWGVALDRTLWVRPKSSADALWAAEQALKSTAFSAIVLWQNEVRNESLRRLALACQGTESWFWLIRPVRAASDASPAPLRLALYASNGGVLVDLVKRRGPHADERLFVPLPEFPAGRAPIGIQYVGPSSEPAPTAVAAVRTAPVLV